ncbi:hypothetical protein M9Y10_034519 [Tritrichomonas musculus]|uniref:Pantothenate kinase n=1 Tax=Tritrichomonas musculus TaxID=1915356 RepID=A0ABR2KF81_9EUKA
MLGVDLGSSLVKLALIEEDGTIKFDHFRTKLDLIKAFFSNEGDHTLKNFAPNGVKAIGTVGAGGCKFNEFLKTLPNISENGDEMGSNAYAVSYLLKTPSQIRVFGGNGVIDDSYVIASMGTGTAFTIIRPGEPMRHVGGTGLGGGTLIGLANMILGINDFDQLCKLASQGDSNKLDLLIRDIAGSDYSPTLKADVIASSFAKAAYCEERPADKDIAAGILSTISFAIGAHVASVCVAEKVSTVVFVGGFLDIDGIISNNLMRSLNLFHPEITLVIPKNYHYMGALGTALKLSHK